MSYCCIAANELQLEVESLATKLRYMEDAKTDIRSDIAVMKRATEKAGVDLSKAEEEKKKQVIMLLRIVEIMQLKNMLADT